MTWETKPELDRLYTVSDMLPEWLESILSDSRSYQVSVPTEVVVTEPRFVVPHQGRVWVNIWLYHHDGALVTYDEVRGPDVTCIGHLDGSVYCTEVYGNEGSDGHTEWEFAGYRFFKGEVAGSRLEHMVYVADDEWRNHPNGPMFSGWHDDDLDRRRGRYEAAE